MSTVWPIALALVLALEGGFVDDPRDPGGVTKYGISVRFAGSIGLDIDGDGRTTGADIRNLTRDQAGHIYSVLFWAKCRCAELPDPLALAVFDAAVNQGPLTARRLLQRALGVTADGVLGPISLAAATAAELVPVLEDFLARRARRYAGTRGFSDYGRGWHRRLFRVHRAALALEAEPELAVAA